MTRQKFQKIAQIRKLTKMDVFGDILGILDYLAKLA